MLQNSKHLGGLKLSKIELRHTTLHATWVSRMQNSNAFDYAYEWLLPDMGKHIWSCNINISDAYHWVKKRTFWSDSVLAAWTKLTFFEPKNLKEVTEQTIWYNSHIKIGALPFKPPPIYHDRRCRTMENWKPFR